MFLFVYLFICLFVYSPLSAGAAPNKSQCVVTKVGNPTDPTPVLPPECVIITGAPTGLGSTANFTFPLKTTKSVILTGSTYNGVHMVWCYTSQINCHHDYNAADIFASTGTTVVAAVSGIVTQAAATTSVGHVVTILGDGGYQYYHAHMGIIKVSLGQTVKPGFEIGAVGTAADAVYTPSHLHFDQLPPGFNGIRPVCSGAACTGYPFINVQPNLTKAYQALP